MAEILLIFTATVTLPAVIFGTYQLAEMVEDVIHSARINWRKRK